MKYNYIENKIVEISPEEIKLLFQFGRLYHPELKTSTNNCGKSNLINYGRLITKLAGLYFKEILKAYWFKNIVKTSFEYYMSYKRIN